MSGKVAWLVVLAVIALLLSAAGHPGHAAVPVLPADSARPSPVRLSPAWTPKMSPPEPVTGTGHDARWPDVAYNSTYNQYLVVWKGGKSIWGRRVDGRGKPWGNVFEIASGPTSGDGRPRVAFDTQRNRYLVIWGRADGLAYQMYGRFVPWDGPDPALVPFAIDPSKPASTQVYALAYGSSPDEFLVVWVNRDAGSTRDMVAGRRVKAGGGFPMGTFVIAAGSLDNRGNPDVAYNAQRNQYLVVYDDYPKVNENIYGKRLSATGIPIAGGEFAIADWPGDEIDPAVASCPATDQYLVAWHGIPTPGDGVWARFVSGLGGLGSMVTLDEFPWWSYHYPLDLACGVTELEMEDPRYLVTWSTSFDLDGTSYAREILTTGSQSDEVQIDRWTGAIAVAGGAINHLVAWETSGSDYDGYTDIYARIVGNTIPKASFTVTPGDAPSTTVFAFDASASNDATDPPSQLQVRWDWGDGDHTTWSRDRTATHKFPLDPGYILNLYRVELEVTDGTGPTTTDTTSTVVLVRNAPPTAAFTVQPATGNTLTTFHFDASGSADPEGGALEVRWDWNNDGAYDTAWSATKIASHAFGQTGIHIIRAQVRDPVQLTGVTTRNVYVSEGGAPSRAYLPLISRKQP